MRILCADNSPVSRMGVTETVSKYGYPTVSEANNYSELLAHLETQTFDLLISELRFQDAELLEGIDQIRILSPTTQILIYTFHANPTYVARAAAHRVYDFVLKKGDATPLLQSIANAKNGSPPPDSLLLKAKGFLGQPLRNGLPASLAFTKREVQILAHLALGLSNREISRSLDIGLETAKEHVQNILRKLKSSDRTVAAVWALRNGVATLDI
ncbi:MAG: response regulator transcription factor [Pirellula sp.]